MVGQLSMNLPPVDARAFPLLLALLLAWLPADALAAAPFDQSHGRFARVLGAAVTNSLVDYPRLKARPEELDACLAEIAAVPAEEFAGWKRDDRLALLLNLYNAQTLRLIVDHYPLKSIRDIGVLPGAAWRMLVVRFGGQVMSLEHLEHQIIRAGYGEPRVHFALVCAARGCPPLRAEPYVGARLDVQLDDQARQFLALPDKNRFDAAKATLWLSPIFKWFTEDFTGPAGSLEKYVQPFLPADAREALGRAAKVKVRYTDYDWSLNELTR